MATTRPRRPVRRPARPAVRRVDPGTQTALDEARVRFGPEEYALNQLLGDAYSELRSSRDIAKETARGIQAVVSAVRGDVVRQYQQFEGTRAASEERLRQDLASLGPTADRFKAPTFANVEESRTRLAESFQRLQTELGQRTIDAQAGAAYETRRSQAAFRDSIGKIRGQQGELAGRIGAYVAGRSYDISQDRAKSQLEASRLEAQIRRDQRTDERAQAGLTGYYQGKPTVDRLRYELSRDRPSSSSGSRPNSRNSLTLGQKNRILDEVRKAASYVRRGKQLGLNTQDIRLLLQTGGKGGGQHSQSVFGGVRIEDENVVNAAMDLVYRGGLSGANARWLRGKGVKTPVAWRHPKPVPQPRTRSQGPLNQSLPDALRNIFGVR